MRAARAIRKRVRLTLEEASKRADISSYAIARFEKEEKDLNDEDIKKLSRVYGVEVDDLLVILPDAEEVSERRASVIEKRLERLERILGRLTQMQYDFYRLQDRHRRETDSLVISHMESVRRMVVHANKKGESHGE